VARLIEASPLRHRIHLNVVGAEVIDIRQPSMRQHGYEGLAFGGLIEPKHRRAPVSIYVATGIYHTMRRRYKLSRKQAESGLLEILCHEWAHYEQHRDGRRIQERGVAVRARSLATAILGVPSRKWITIQLQGGSR
jgi:hypothetical protein